MKTVLSFLLIFAVVLPLESNKDSDPRYIALKKMPKIGEVLPNELRKVNSSGIMYIASSQMATMYHITHNSIKFRITINDKKRISFFCTFDKNFVTENGFSMKTTYGEVKNYLNSEPIREIGFGFYFALRNGWRVAFIDKDFGINEVQFPDNMKVSFFFKRDYYSNSNEPATLDFENKKPTTRAKPKNQELKVMTL